ncbi:MAG: MBL fold metallo-hydrolase [Anaerolineales bacterium]|jgi:glyoxylase-like metal-dependent hydrolase (beta-lactamase superfamily II)|nr:MBL fold metallo-hydrolase [Anaerolineales bacterium]
MIQRERIADTVYSFQSEVYAQVTAGTIVGPNWAVVIDTLALPEETLEIRDFIEQELSVPVRYVINTHSHADHAWGNCFFPGATVIGHTLCRSNLEHSRPTLEEVRKQNPAYRNVRLVLPQVTFDEGYLNLRVGKKTLTLMPLPGHSADNIAVLVEEDRVLFAGDAAMSLPYIVNGDVDALAASLKKIGKMGLENVIQGHGDIVLRGEIDNFIKDNLTYLSNIKKVVRKSSKRKYPQELLDETTVESCGKSRVLIGGLAAELHRRNLRALYRQLYGELPVISDDEDEEYYEDEDEDDED